LVDSFEFYCVKTFILTADFDVTDNDHSGSPATVLICLEIASRG